MPEPSLQLSDELLLIIIIIIISIGSLWLRYFRAVYLGFLLLILLYRGHEKAVNRRLISIKHKAKKRLLGDYLRLLQEMGAAQSLGGATP